MVLQFKFGGLNRARCRWDSILRAGCGTLLLILAGESVAARPGQNQEWASVNGNLAGQRYARLDQINATTVARLGAAWVSEQFADGASSRMTPLVHGKLMFFGAGANIYALDARTGKLAWRHQTENRQLPGDPTLLDAQASAMAVIRSWGLGLGGGMIYAGLGNGHVIALREGSGELVWDKVINDEVLPMSKSITCPPLYVDGVLYFGISVEYSRGFVVAVDAKSGRVLWRSPTVPGPGEPGHETWPRDSEIWRSGGAAPWVAGAADPALGLVYFATGNAGPNTGGKIRPGDNLYSVSLIALQMKTGKMRWYRQLVHHDIWEADLSVPPVLFDRRRADGSPVRGVAVMRGDGYLFLFDRSTGEPLVPIEERPVPQNPALFTAATQPFPRGADSVLDSCESWKGKVPTGFILGCMFEPPSHDVPNKLALFASIRMHPISYDPQTRYFYAQGTNSLMAVGTGDDPYFPDLVPPGGGPRIPNYPPPHTVAVAAIDSLTSKVVWKKELPAADDSGVRSNGGALSSAGGLVFHQGGDGTLQAYDALTGETLWRFQTGFAVADTSPMSYAIGGTQYVALILGAKVWAFALDGKLPQAAPIPPAPREELKGPIEDTNRIETLSLEHYLANGRRYRLNEHAFNPFRARVRAGSAVTFINNGYQPHTIIAQDGSWTTGTLEPTQIKTLSFDKPGSYLYTFKEYPWSYGQIIVVPALTSGASAGSAASAQVDLGKGAYATSCSACHGENLSGQDRSPALIGARFNSGWAGRKVVDLFERIRATMPQSSPGSLSDETYAAIVAYLLSSNNHPADKVLNLQTMKDFSVTAQ